MKKTNIFRRVFIGFGLTCGVLGILVFALFSNPKLLFSYSLTVGNISFYATKPIPAESAELLARIENQLARFFPDTTLTPMSLFVTGAGWRNQLFFARSPTAGGVVYYPLTKAHGFLSGADFVQNRLIKSGIVVPAPKTLEYFSIHELTHVILGQRLGVMRFHGLPVWVTEGLPDYVALGPAIIIEGRQQNAGAYPQYHQLVTWFLSRENRTFEQLLETELSFAEVTEQAQAAR